MNVLVLVDIVKILYSAQSDVEIKLVYREVSGVGWVQCWDGTWDNGILVLSDFVKVLYISEYISYCILHI